MSPQNEMAASLRRDGFSPDEIAAMIAPGASIADAPNPTQLRWGLDDVMWGDDGSVIVMLSGPEGEPYWLELEQDRAAVLRQNLAGPDDEGLSGPCDCGEGAVHYTAADCPAAQPAAAAAGGER